ncbi:hypothetical protein SAMN05518684_10435 [Salipaludibacillus aurantiacus]|uniref:Uncharacterized protein n=1 Tax=Salipaludibacillus aurantiacus TaxID=1601833 RepID=A0A1H9S5I6_9BACI|nr:hypothetical protein SAMN05518684_10435 [Salipaludibacillus aurantiacus]
MAIPTRFCGFYRRDLDIYVKILLRGSSENQLKGLEREKEIFLGGSL